MESKFTILSTFEDFDKSKFYGLLLTALPPSPGMSTIGDCWGWSLRLTTAGAMAMAKTQRGASSIVPSSVAGGKLVAGQNSDQIEKSNHNITIITATLCSQTYIMWIFTKSFQSTLLLFTVVYYDFK